MGRAVNPGTLVAFAVLELALCLIPGPAVLLTISHALRRGTRAGLAAATGILVGNTLYFLLSALGIVALLFASYGVFTVVKWAGVAYLAFVALRATFARHGVDPNDSALRAGERRRALTSGFATQISNPKAIVFFAAILPQFIDPHRSIYLQVAVLTLTSAAIELGVLTAYSLAADRLRRSAAAERASLWIERAGGLVLLAIAAWIAREPLVTP